jgi:hypothetical protein
MDGLNSAIAADKRASRLEEVMSWNREMMLDTRRAHSAEEKDEYLSRETLIKASKKVFMADRQLERAVEVGLPRVSGIERILSWTWAWITGRSAGLVSGEVNGEERGRTCWRGNTVMAFNLFSLLKKR